MGFLEDSTVLKMGFILWCKLTQMASRELGVLGL